MYPSLEEVIKLRQSSNLVPIYREIIADLETPVSAFLKLNNGGYSFLLESVEGGERLGRYSFIGIEPYQVLKIAADAKVDPLQAVATEIQKYRIAEINGLPKFTGGAIIRAFQLLSSCFPTPCLSSTISPTGLKWLAMSISTEILKIHTEKLPKKLTHLSNGYDTPFQSHTVFRQYPLYKQR